jgi:hypothetical protein
MIRNLKKSKNFLIFFKKTLLKPRIFYFKKPLFLNFSFFEILKKFNLLSSSFFFLIFSVLTKKKKNKSSLNFFISFKKIFNLFFFFKKSILMKFFKK